MKGMIFHVKDFFNKHGSTVLTVAGSIGVVGTAVLTTRATIKAIDILKKEDKEHTPKEVMKLTWKEYIPTALVAGTTIGCIVGANTLNLKVQKELASAYNMLSSYFFAYRDQVKEIYGEEGHNKVIDGIIKHKCEDVYMYTQGILSNSHLYFDTTDPDKIRTFYDSYSQRYFESTASRVLEAEYHLNRNYILGGGISINEFYEYLGLEKVEGGDEVGWDSFQDEICWIDFDHTTATLDDGMEIFVIDFVFGPTTLSYYYDN